MRVFDFDWQSEDNLKLFGQGFLPNKNPKAIVCLVHGFGEHIGRYVETAKYFTAKEYGLVGFDSRGHGRSEGKRGHTPQYELLIKDIDNFTALTAGKFKNFPVFLYGHSMGGNEVINFLIRKQAAPQFRGAIISSPWLRLPKPSAKIVRLSSKILDAIIPNYTLKIKLDVSQLSRDQKIGEQYKKDILVHDCMTCHMLAAIVQSGEWAIQNADRLRIPLLIVQGKADKITSIQASELFYEKVVTRKKFIKYDHCRHELHNEINKKNILDDITQWIKRLV